MESKRELTVEVPGNKGIMLSNSRGLTSDICGSFFESRDLNIFHCDSLKRSGNLETFQLFPIARGQKSVQAELSPYS